MKDSVIILCGGGPAPGMNSVSMSVAKTFLSKGYRVIGLHGGYSGLFSKNARTEDLSFQTADRYFNRGGSYLQMSRFKPTDKGLRGEFQPRSLQGQQHQAACHHRRRRHRFHCKQNFQVPYRKGLSYRKHPLPEDYRQRPSSPGKCSYLRLQFSQE